MFNDGFVFVCAQGRIRTCNTISGRAYYLRSNTTREGFSRLTSASTNFATCAVFKTRPNFRPVRIKMKYNFTAKIYCLFENCKGLE